MMRSTALVPKPGTRSSSSRLARLTSSGKRSRWRSAQASFGSMSSGSMPSLLVDDLAGVEAVEPHQPVGLIEPVLAHQRRRCQRQRAAGIGDRAEGGVIDALEPVGAVEIGAGVEDGLVVGAVGADDHLRALAGRREARRLCLRRRLAGFLGFIELQPQPAHGAADRAHVLFRREFCEAVLLGHLDVDARDGRHICRPPRSARRRPPEWS